MPKTIDEQINDINAKAAGDIERIKQKAVQEAERARMRAEAHAAVIKATEELQARLEAEHGMVGHPKAGLLWSKAWDMGHASGLGEVEICYSDLVELVK